VWLADDVAFAYGRQTVLDGISLELQPGRCYGLLGPNGSGKTTLLDLFCRLQTPDRGTLAVQGRSLSAWPVPQLARVQALVPQEFLIRFRFTVREVVEMGRHPHLPRFGSLTADDHALVDSVMAELDIANLASRPVTELSGGEKQRVAVARALVQEPAGLLLDEATSNLDIYHSLTILDVIRKRVTRDGLTVLAALHDLNLAAWFCDELIFLSQGRVVAMGRVEEVLRPEIIGRVYGVEAMVREDDFSRALQVSYRLQEESR